VSYQVKTKAYILDKEPGWGNEGYIYLFSQDFGYIRVIASGLYKTGSRLASITEPPIEAQCNLIGGDNKVFRLTTLSPTNHLENVKNNYQNLSWYFLLVYILKHFLNFNTKNDRLFNLWNEVITSKNSWLNETNTDLSFIYFILRMLEEEGFCPLWNSCTNCQKLWEKDENAYYLPSEGGLLCKECIKPINNQDPILLNFLEVLPKKYKFQVPKGFLRITPDMLKLLKNTQKETELDKIFTNQFYKSRISSRTISRTRNFLLIFTSYLL